MKTYVFLLSILMSLVLSSTLSHSQVSAITKSQLPGPLSFKGEFKEGKRWTDKEGEHLIVLTQTPRHIMTDQSKFKGWANPAREASLNVYHLNYLSGRWQQKWMIYDFVSECGLDVVVNFFPNSFDITDLDNDGVKEVWVMYVTGCTSEWSTLTMKIIMYTRGKKYAVRGNTQETFEPGDVQGGDYKMDNAFMSGPAAFRQYAARMWDQKKQFSWW